MKFEDSRMQNESLIKLSSFILLILNTVYFKKYSKIIKSIPILNLLITKLQTKELKDTWLFMLLKHTNVILPNIFIANLRILDLKNVNEVETRYSHLHIFNTSFDLKNFHPS